MEGSRKTFDRLKNVEVKPDQKTVDELCNNLSKYGKRKITETDLINSGILKERNGRFEATNAFALLTHSDAFLFTTVKCARFKGTDTKEFIDRKEFSIPLYEQIDKAYSFVLDHINLSGSINGLVREDTYEIPPSSIREAIMNAVIHRSYVMENRSIYVAVFDDRVEVTSPGMLYGSMSIERIKSGLSVPRNPALARIFGLAGLVEGWGTGIRRMISECAEHGLKEPEFELIGTDFRVTLYRQLQKADKESPSGYHLDEVESLVLNALRTDGNITIDELSEKIHASRSSVKRAISSLKDQKRIIRKGNNRNGSWAVQD